MPPARCHLNADHAQCNDTAAVETACCCLGARCGGGIQHHDDVCMVCFCTKLNCSCLTTACEVFSTCLCNTCCGCGDRPSRDPCCSRRTCCCSGANSRSCAGTTCNLRN